MMMKFFCYCWIYLSNVDDDAIVHLHCRHVSIVLMIFCDDYAEMMNLHVVNDFHLVIHLLHLGSLVLMMNHCFLVLRRYQLNFVMDRLTSTDCSI